MSFVGSKPITCAVSLALEPNGLTDVSSSPATTCAAVTTEPGAASHPEPSIPSPHAVPRMRTTLGAADRTPGRLNTCGFGGGTCATGPPSAGNGSSRASACNRDDGGSKLFSCLRTNERCTSRRRDVWPEAGERPLRPPRPGKGPSRHPGENRRPCPANGEAES